MMIKTIFQCIFSPSYFVHFLKLQKNLRKIKKGKSNTFPIDAYIIGEREIEIGNLNYFGKNIKLHTWKIYHNEGTGFDSKLIIGNKNYFGDFCYITALDKIIIGNGCCFGDNVFISDNSHGNPNKLLEDKTTTVVERKLYSKGVVKIGNNVWVGRNSCILGGVTIGDNVIIGANSVVTHDIEANSVYAGCPAKKIR